MDHKIVILDAGTFYNYPDIISELEELGTIKSYDNTNPTEIAGRISEATIVLTNKVILSEKELSKAPLLKLICVTATGMNNIDLEAAKKLNIIVKNAKNYSTDSVAQATFGMALHFLMNFSIHNEFVRSRYQQHAFFTHLNPGFSELKGKTWGIIGLGAIGKKVAQIAAAFGCNIIYHSPSGQIQDVSYRHEPLDALMSRSTIISIHSPLNQFTKNLIDYGKLKLCKKNAILINVARGGIVNEADLKKALDEDLLLGTAADVFSSEPIFDQNPLLEVNNKEKILLTPHIAWGSFEARKELIRITKQNIKVFLQTGK